MQITDTKPLTDFIPPKLAPVWFSPTSYRSPNNFTKIDFSKESDDTLDKEGIKALNEMRETLKKSSCLEQIWSAFIDKATKTVESRYTASPLDEDFSKIEFNEKVDKEVTLGYIQLGLESIRNVLLCTEIAIEKSLGSNKEVNALSDAYKIYHSAALEKCERIEDLMQAMEIINFNNLDFTGSHNYPWKNYVSIEEVR